MHPSKKIYNRKRMKAGMKILPFSFERRDRRRILGTSVFISVFAKAIDLEVISKGKSVCAWFWTFKHAIFKNHLGWQSLFCSKMYDFLTGILHIYEMSLPLKRTIRRKRRVVLCGCENLVHFSTSKAQVALTFWLMPDARKLVGIPCFRRGPLVLIWLPVYQSPHSV